MGNNISSKGGVTSCESCREYCTSVQGCKFWTHDTKTNICYAKTTDAGRTPKAGVISGPKDCARKGTALVKFHFLHTNEDNFFI